MKAIHSLTFILAIACTFSLTLHSQNWGNGIKGEGPKVTRTLDISTFDGIALGINANVYLKQGNTQSVKVEAQQNMIDNLEQEVKNGTWKISFDQNVRNHDGIKIWITVKDLNKIALSGSGNIMSEEKFSDLGDLELSVSGSGDIQFESVSKSLSAAISGSGDINLKGATGPCRMSITGSGDISALNLKAKTCSVKITGSGDSAVNVSEQLDVSIVGSGDVVYTGGASVRSKITGSGSVESK